MNNFGRPQLSNNLDRFRFVDQKIVIGLDCQLQADPCEQFTFEIILQNEKQGK